MSGFHGYDAWKTASPFDDIEVEDDQPTELDLAYQRIQELENQNLKPLLDRISKLEATLEEAREYLDGYSDIADQHDEDGSPRPNRAMQICSEIDETLHGRPF